MKNKKIIIISIIALTILAIFAYIFTTDEVEVNCRKYSYDKCPDGCIVSSSGPMTADIGCFPKNHQDNWPK